MRPVQALALLLVLGLASPALAEEGSGLDVELAARSSSLEPGKGYLVSYTVTYPCAGVRWIQLEAHAPTWARAAVENFEARGERCFAGPGGLLERHKGELIVAVDATAEPGARGVVLLVARDGDLEARGEAPIKVRPDTPSVSVAPASASLLEGQAGAPIHFEVETTYTLLERGQVAWTGSSPAGWVVTVPATRLGDPVEDATLTEVFSVLPPESASGLHVVVLRGVLRDATGAVVAESPPASFLFSVGSVPSTDDVEPDWEEPVVEHSTAGEAQPLPPRETSWLVPVSVVLGLAAAAALFVRGGRRA